MSRAIGYCRVSTDQQAMNGLSLDLQQERIKAYATAKGFKLIDIIVDGGFSGKRLTNRPGMQRIFNLIQLKKADHVIVYKLDRAFRSTKDALKTMEIFEKNKISFHSICETIDTQSANGRLFYTILCAMAQWEGEQIGERVKAVWTKKKAEGKKCGGLVPYGFTNVKGRLIPDAKDQEMLRAVTEMRKEGSRLQDIADDLNRRDIRTKTGKTWNPALVHHVLKVVA